MGKFKISVVTPYHNVDHTMFDGCVESMKSQTIGFENVEWVIVIHNCSKEYTDYARDKLGSFENVILKEINNDIKFKKNAKCCTHDPEGNRRRSRT